MRKIKYKFAKKPYKITKKLIKSKKEFKMLRKYDVVIKSIFLLGNKTPSFMGKMIRIPEYLKTMINLDYVGLYSLKIWKRLNDEQKEALVFHELLHCNVIMKKGIIKCKIIKHDIEEFFKIADEYSNAFSDIRKMFNILKNKNKRRLK